MMQCLFNVCVFIKVKAGGLIQVKQKTCTRLDVALRLPHVPPVFSLCECPPDERLLQR
jgi:hypothetical protein